MCAVESSQKDKTKLQINTLPNTKWIYPVCMRGLMDTVCHSVDDLEDKSHDAGYDSLMTCIIFILQSNYILREQNSQTTKLSSIGDTMSLALNRIRYVLSPWPRLVKTQPNMIYLNGSETDTVRHFYMCNFPSNWKKWEIMKVCIRRFRHSPRCGYQYIGSMRLPVGLWPETMKMLEISLWFTKCRRILPTGDCNVIQLVDLRGILTERQT